ncbi:hypothetical protein OSB04_un001258 [Centaurea solstitialis]|uniref:Uncharacterized protein n=1 Tax=Centaurea solstitialis TaxID=347529 RepID=A0AA38SGG5_9ASTR|nr:hypothetical protein OSB04_un001258 [Centaurea solstitialis]
MQKRLGGLNNNSFVGFIPPSIGNLTNLSWFWVSGNQLQGSIPLGLDKLVNARHLIMNNNRLSGTIPSSLSLVETLEATPRPNLLSGNSASESKEPPKVLVKQQSEWICSEPDRNEFSLYVKVGFKLDEHCQCIVLTDMSNNSFDLSDIPTCSHFHH